MKTPKKKPVWQEMVEASEARKKMKTKLQLTLKGDCAAVVERAVDVILDLPGHIPYRRDRARLRHFMVFKAVQAVAWAVLRQKELPLFLAADIRNEFQEERDARLGREFDRMRWKLDGDKESAEGEEGALDE